MNKLTLALVAVLLSGCNYIGNPYSCEDVFENDVKTALMARDQTGQAFRIYAGGMTCADGFGEDRKVDRDCARAVFDDKIVFDKRQSISIVQKQADRTVICKMNPKYSIQYGNVVRNSMESPTVSYLYRTYEDGSGYDYKVFVNGY